MPQSDSNYDELEKFLNNLEVMENVYIVMPGAVISGFYLTYDKKVIKLTNSAVETGGSNVETQDLIIPIEKVLAWGYKED